MSIKSYSRVKKSKSVVKKSKYRAIKTEVDGILFDSKKEAEYYKKLSLLKKNGLIKTIALQVAFNYEINYTANERIFKAKGKYIADFIVTYNDGSIEVIDVKGFRTPEYKRKKKIVENLYQIKIIEK